MTYNKDDIAELEDLCDLVRDWMKENCSGMPSVMVTLSQTILNEEAYVSEERDESDTVRQAARKRKDELLPFSGKLLEAVNDWMAYKKERRQAYKDRGRKSLIKQIQSHANEYGDDAVAEVIMDSIASGYQGIVFDRLKNSGRNRELSFYDIGEEMLDGGGLF